MFDGQVLDAECSLDDDAPSPSFSSSTSLSPLSPICSSKSAPAPPSSSLSTNYRSLQPSVSPARPPTPPPPPSLSSSSLLCTLDTGPTKGVKRMGRRKSSFLSNRLRSWSTERKARTGGSENTDETSSHIQEGGRRRTRGGSLDTAREGVDENEEKDFGSSEEEDGPNTVYGRQTMPVGVLSNFLKPSQEFEKSAIPSSPTFQILNSNSSRVHQLSDASTYSSQHFSLMSLFSVLVCISFFRFLAV